MTNAPPELPGNIGIADVYRVVTDLQSALTKIGEHLARVDTRNEFADRQAADVEARLRVIEAARPTEYAATIEALTIRVATLERFRYMLAGAIALLTLLLTMAGYFVGSSVHH